MEKEDEREKIHAELNHIYFYSEVDRQSIHTLINLIKNAEEYCCTLARVTSTKRIPIYLHINSHGGDLLAAFSTIDTIKNSRIPIISITTP